MAINDAAFGNDLASCMCVSHLQCICHAFRGNFICYVNLSLEEISSWFRFSDLYTCKCGSCNLPEAESRVSFPVTGFHCHKTND